MACAESKEKGSHLPILGEPTPKAQAMAEICKRWVEVGMAPPSKKIRGKSGPRVSDEELDKRAQEIWERKRIVKYD